MILKTKSEISLFGNNLWEIFRPLFKSVFTVQGNVFTSDGYLGALST